MRWGLVWALGLSMGGGGRTGWVDFEVDLARLFTSSNLYKRKPGFFISGLPKTINNKNTTHRKEEEHTPRSIHGNIKERALRSPMPNVDLSQVHHE